jgi:hypothetical protein
MRGHALVSGDYTVKLINTLMNHSLEDVTKEREGQLRILANLLKNDK